MAEKDATEKSGASEEQKTVSKHQERRESVERVLEGRHEDMKSEGLDIDPGEELVPPEEEEREVEADTPEVTPTEEEPEKEPTPDEEMVTIKVRGEEQQVPKSQVLDAGTRVLQKETDLEKRYDEVTKMQKELQRQLGSLPKKEEKKTPTDTEVDEDIDVSQLAYDLQYGTSEEAEAAILKLRGGSPGLSDDSIRDTVLRIREEEKAAEVFKRMQAPADKGGYGDLMDEGPLQKRFAAEVDILVEHEGMAYDSFETYKKAGDLVRKTYVSATTKVEVPLSKKERKEATDTVTGANIKDKSEQETETIPKSGDGIATDVILDMKRNRGQL